ncbi:MAG: twin-arginine translocase subunit TatC [Sphingomonadaceae bacterium]|nr:twin-arginine translocase subunit TatC [Sphingomonadaceae bacterium]
MTLPAVTPDDDIDASRAPLMEHLIELRKRLLISIVALVIAFAIAYTRSKAIFTFLVQPLIRAEGGHPTQLIFTRLYDGFFVQVKVAAFAALCLAFPVIANQLWAFVAPGLYRREKRAFLPFLIMTPVLFTMGAALAYYVVAPISFRFFLQFSDNGATTGFAQTALPSIDSYLSLIMHFMAGFGIAFLLPVLLMLLERAGLVTRAQLKSGRRYAIVGAFVVAAVLAPPDVVSQCLLAVPLVALYEGSIVGIWFSERRRARDDAEGVRAAAE